MSDVTLWRSFPMRCLPTDKFVFCYPCILIWTRPSQEKVEVKFTIWMTMKCLSITERILTQYPEGKYRETFSIRVFVLLDIGRGIHPTSRQVQQFCRLQFQPHPKWMKNEKIWDMYSRYVVDLLRKLFKYHPLEP